ncbi:hypothetical protein FI667_g11872, partial [Globisporangium splendens]
MQFPEPTKGYRDEEAPMMTPTPATEGVDPNGVVVGKWKMGLWNLFAVCIPNDSLLAYLMFSQMTQDAWRRSVLGSRLPRSVRVWGS